MKGPSVMTATNAVIPMTRGARFLEMLRGSTTVAKYTHTRANVQINSKIKTATPLVSERLPRTTVESCDQRHDTL